jgi:hypothetical protein
VQFTYRNHYNPCFWTAFWNTEYFLKAKSGLADLEQAREQVVHVLNLKSNKLLTTTVERIHYDKNLGVADISYESAVRFVKKYHGDQYEKFLDESKKDEYPVFIDFEDTLTALETTPAYETLLTVIRTENIDNLIEKTNIATFVVLQNLRSHAIMNAMIQWNDEIGDAKFDYFMNLKWMLGDPKFLFQLMHPLLTARWQLYTSPTHIFPLCDSPILISPESVMVAISPRLLLEILVSERTDEDSSPSSQRITPEKLFEYRRRTVGNTFREIVGQKDTLLEWQSSQEFSSRSALMKNVTKYNAMIRANGKRELWKINAFGNMG